MNAASQLLRILAIIGAIAAGALFYLTQGKISDLNSKLRDAQSSGANTSANAAALKTAQDAADKAAADNKSLADALKAAKDAADTADSYRASALKDLDAAQKASRDKDSTISDLNDKITDLNKQVGSVGDLQAETATEKAEIARLQALVDSGPAAKPAAGDKTPAKGTAAAAAEAPVAAPLVVLSAPAPATVMQIDVKNGVIALNVGTDAGVDVNTHLLLKSEDQELAQVIVDGSKPGLATGRIISTGNMSTKDFAKIVVSGLKVSFERVQ